jgi:hypothetical protein
MASHCLGPIQLFNLLGGASFKLRHYRLPRTLDRDIAIWYPVPRFGRGAGRNIRLVFEQLVISMSLFKRLCLFGEPQCEYLVF